MMWYSCVCAGAALALAGEPSGPATAMPSRAAVVAMAGHNASVPRTLWQAHDWPELQRQYHASSPHILVVDDFLTPSALRLVREWLRQATMWHHAKAGANHLVAYWDDGLATPLQLQIAGELQRLLPTVLGNVPLIVHRRSHWRRRGVGWLRAPPRSLRRSCCAVARCQRPLVLRCVTLPTATSTTRGNKGAASRSARRGLRFMWCVVWRCVPCANALR